MNKFFFFFLLLSFFWACANETKPTGTLPKESEVTNPIAPLNPNGDSELALLMRKMEAHWKETRKILEDGQSIGETPQFGNMLTATPTDESMKDENFEGFARAYLSQINALGQANPEAQKQAYNNVVNACIVCHENSCSGPIPRIKKLLISE
ncbi:MAG TPA: hypothetical protein ENK85_03980 [Saprospiraceae bacterium]|nr:hypothetical protein [Saprospiraceae bacterium]